MEDENECRVCRGGPEEDRPLFTPCHCRGSIGQVHQSCLEEWLTHSHKSVCELCHLKYQFIPFYSPSMPAKIPLQVLILTSLQHILPRSLAFLIRLLVTLTMWLLVMPLCTCWLYRLWLTRHPALAPNRSTLLYDVVSGLTIASVIALSFIVMMSFTDFLRNHWDQGINRGMGAQRRRRNRLHPNAVQAPQAPVPPPPMGLNNEELLLHAEEHERAMMHEILANEHVQRAIIQQQQEAEAPGPLDLNNAPQEAFNMNNNDVNAADEAAILNAMNNEDEADMQLALDELIGLRGPWHIPFRNVMWLLLFNAIYIGIFAFVPYNIGHSAKAALYHYFHSYIQLLTPFIPLSWTSMLEDFFRLSRVSRNDLQLPTVLTIGTGFVVIAAIAFLAGSVLTHMHSTIPRIFINHYVATFNELTLIIKVGLLLFHRIFVLPIALGLAVLGCFKGFLEFDDCSWVEFAANNIVGFLALSWAVGISFMLTVTLTVLQLREVLHPDILARIIRPQEAHSELLKSLKTESTITHARRTCISMLVYLLILLFYVYFPIQVCRLLGGSMFPLKIKLWYFLPEIQLPVELSLAHIAFLTILEKKKDIIGQIEHIWFKRAAELLHFERFVLPYMAVTAAAAGVDQGETVEAMVRPAPNWDAHNGEANVSRWAWGDEALGDTELKVLPREPTDYWLAKSLLLGVLFWLFTVATELGVLFIPLFFGKLIWFSLQLPDSLRHDPLCYGIGVFTFIGGYQAFVQASRRIDLSLLRAALWGLPLSTAKTALSVVWKYCAIITSFAMILHLMKYNPRFLSWDGFARDILTSSTLLNLLLALGLSGALETAMHRLQLPFPLEDAKRGTLRHGADLLSSLEGRNWTAVEMALNGLDVSLLQPLYDTFVTNGIFTIVQFSIPLGGVAYYMTDFLRGICPFSVHELMLNAASGLAFGIIGWWISRMLQIPVSVISGEIYSMVRDQKYLIGKKLCNIQEVQPQKPDSTVAAY